MKKKYVINVQETLSKLVVVEAKNEAEATQKVIDAYQNGEIVLDYDGFLDVQMIDETDNYDQEQVQMLSCLSDDIEDLDPEED